MPVVEVPEGYTALVKGPSCVKCPGGCRVFGGIFHGFEVPPHKQYPVEGPASIVLESGAVEFVRGSTIPPDWRVELEGVVALAGPVDSGKSSLSTYLVNLHAGAGKRACVIDADVGQSDIGPPGFVTLSCTSAPVPHISELEPQDGYYVGSASPHGVEELLTAGVVQCLRRAAAQHPHLVVINTPGWVTGRGLQLLRALVDATGARVISIGGALLRGITVSRPQHVLPRGLHDRRELRNYAYRRHLKLALAAEADHSALTLCEWRGALECPWGTYAAADVSEPQRRGRERVVPRHYLRYLLAALYKEERLAGYGIVERLEPRVALRATTADFDEVRVGRIRVDPQSLEELEPLP
jgi:polynucleotide 5'-hydroxyl-kinase GRC3/NOL9